MLHQGLCHPLTHGPAHRVRCLAFGSRGYLLCDYGHVSSHLRISCPVQEGIMLLILEQRRRAGICPSAPGPW